jgi:hypothetical protein
MLRFFKPKRTVTSVGIYLPCYFDGDKFTKMQLDIPAHDQYNLNDLMSAGVKLSPVNTEIVHDDVAMSNLINFDKK